MIRALLDVVLLEADVSKLTEGKGQGNVADLVAYESLEMAAEL